MNQQPDQLSKLLLEADGLLLLLHRHRDETPIDAIKLLRRKLELILALTEGLDDDNDDDEPQHAVESVGEYIEDTIENPSFGEDDTKAVVSNDSTTPDDVTEDVCEETPSDDTKQDSTTEEQIEDNVQTSVEILENEKVELHDSTDTGQIAFVEECEEPMFYEQSIVEMPEDSDTDMHTKTEPKPEQENEPQQEHESVPEMAVSRHTYIIKEPDDLSQLHHAPRRSISTVFNLNDKFRFRRELFANSDAQYVECLDILSAMASLDEAREYLVDDLKWNPENEDVKAFLELLTNYYK
ncbi:MAG: hypothetical protein NC082_06690 [Clostridiales bacterium]|nr:hypothetical protein [Clostridiales bacterium]